MSDRTKPITHHLDDATLMSFAAGSLPEALAAVAAAHMAVCPTCRRTASDMERIGGVVFSLLPGLPTQRPAPVTALYRLKADPPPAPRAAASSAGAELPARLAEAIGTSDLDSLPWRRLGRGVWHHKLATADGDLRLLKVGPGRRMPEHGHGGSELTLLLRGAYSDQTGRYEAGDVADLDADTEHMPVADPTTGCICLIASERPAKFKRLWPRLVQPLAGI